MASRPAEKAEVTLKKPPLQSGLLAPEIRLKSLIRLGPLHFFDESGVHGCVSIPFIHWESTEFA